jgi:lactoylglutathione lyase
MARIEHVAMWAEDLDCLASFYKKYFGADIGPVYENPAKGFQSRFLTFDQSARLELVHSSTFHPVAPTAGTQRMGLTHLAVSVGSCEIVDQ